MKHKLKPCFRASVDGDTLELLVYEDIGENWWSGGGITAKNVKQQIDQAGSYSSITVRINSPGGDAFEGVAIMNVLKSQKKPVNVHVDGIAASAASIIAMAGDTITMGTSSMMMIHNAWTFCAGNADDMRQCGNVLDTISRSMGEAYVAKTGKTAAEIKTLMDAETWLSAQECLDQGFATSITAESDDAEQMSLAKSFKALGKLHNVPEALKPAANAGVMAAGCSCACANCKDDDCAGCEFAGAPSPKGCTGTGCDCMDDDGDTADNSNLSQYEARLKLLRIGGGHADHA